MEVQNRMEKQDKVLVVMGSDSDYSVMRDCLKTLHDFEVDYDCVICSAHRTPYQAQELAANAMDNGYKCIIAAAGKAAHLPGVLAAFTILPVIGVPIKSDALDGMDALLAMAQMPPGIPVATVAINGSTNGAITAIEILAAGGNMKLRQKMLDYKNKLAQKVNEKNAKLQEKIAEEKWG